MSFLNRLAAKKTFDHASIGVAEIPADAVARALSEHVRRAIARLADMDEDQCPLVVRAGAAMELRAAADALLLELHALGTASVTLALDTKASALADRVDYVLDLCDVPPAS